MKSTHHKLIGGLFIVGSILFSGALNAQVEIEDQRERIEFRHERTDQHPRFDRNDRARLKHNEAHRNRFKQKQKARHHMDHKRMQQRRPGSNATRQNSRMRMRSLDNAYQSGAINKRQYRKSKKRMMNRKMMQRKNQKMNRNIQH